MAKGRAALFGCGAVVVLALVVLVATAAGSYNRLVGLDEGVDTAWSQVENVYQRRGDLIPNLVETVKGAAAFERDTFTAVTEARARAGQVTLSGAPENAEQLRQFEQAQDQLSSALSRLLVVVERYPELRATEAFRDLQAQLEGTENRISVERMRFNEAAREYNTARRRFPTVIIAPIMGFEQKPYFEAVAGADEPPPVQF
ncbi:MAG TPA: LemA family protein [Thermoanaerobaculia bacterium]|nr:LemA family protein [Thermoanaerobaculia bacterium]